MKHKKKLIGASIATVLLLILEFVPVVRQAILTGDTAPLIELTKGKLAGAIDAGIDF